LKPLPRQTRPCNVIGQCSEERQSCEKQTGKKEKLEDRKKMENNNNIKRTPPTPCMDMTIAFPKDRDGTIGKGPKYTQRSKNK
jgi:hypothetical protein